MLDLSRDKTVSDVISRLKIAGTGAVKVEGSWGSYARLLAAQVKRETARPMVFVCGHIEAADNAGEDLRTFGAEGVEVFPAWEGEDEFVDATDEVRAERVRVALDVHRRGDFVLATSVQALCQPIVLPESLEANELKLKVGKTVDPEGVSGWLVDNGFERVERVDMPGQFAMRGGIVDVFAPVVRSMESVGRKGGKAEAIAESGAVAIRVEFFGDEIESIRRVDLDTQRSSEEIGRVGVISVSNAAGGEQGNFLDVLPADTLLVFEDMMECSEVAEVYVERSELEGLYGWGDIFKSAGRFGQLHVSRFGYDGDFVKVDVQSVQKYQHKATAVWSGHKETLLSLADQGRDKRVYLYCERQAEIQRLEEIFAEEGVKPGRGFKLELGYVSQGFEAVSVGLIVISHHEIFGQFAVRRRRQRAVRSSMPVDTLSDLQVGDYVVHLSYGVGRYLGIEVMERAGQKNEYLTLQFADGVKMHVSVQNISLVQKFIGTSPTKPRLSKIGTKKWQKQKKRIAESVEDLASELLDMQAKRKALGGFAFEGDSAWQLEFEESFPYQETADQLTAMAEIKKDMEEPAAMDRLLCGDVGYGKTELAMRAAFKAVQSGKQVAVLVPTTVLCVQHGRTFAERFADFPVNIEVLNRFKTARQARDIVERTRKGEVDILIGTHRLVSKDVGFADLGLVVIDEEQRFGVAHKERLKKLRVNVDVLTMTATPIPRTLHMSLLGLRDISSLQTPPLDRRAVVTEVTRYRNDLARKVILRELNRQGQVFFLHNRVKSIDKKAWDIRRLISDTQARVAVGHGQMPKKELEKVMIDFVNGQVDVLVCTTIIESGLDIPNANTMLIDNADRFGLAELHQLRGRVGRYKHRAYAYMLMPENRPVTPIAAKRLKAIEEYSHLGAGFRIALRDLEIRGAGNILGSQQSGHIQEVGYQLYCDLLTDAVKRLRNEPVEKSTIASVDLGFSTYIPKSYIAQDRQRLEVYRKISAVRSQADIDQLRDELTDVYGPLPEDVQMMLELGELRIAAADWGVKSISVARGNLVFVFESEKSSRAQDMFARVRGNVSVVNPTTIYLRLEESYFEPATLLGVLRKVLRRKR